MGFDGLFFGRLDYADKEKRLKEKTMEMIWKGKRIYNQLSFPFIWVDISLWIVLYHFIVKLQITIIVFNVAL